MSNRQKTGEKQPNFVVIMSDQHRKDAMGCMGNLLAVTPNMDRLAREGIVFDNFYTNSPLCVPARMSFLTGQHPSRHHCWMNKDSLNSGIATFAHSLGAAGYETVLSGRMHIVGPDQHHGFEKRPVGDNASLHWGDHRPLLDSFLGPLNDTPMMKRASMEKSGPGQSGYMQYDEKILAATIKWIEERKKSNEQRPFCLVSGFLAPHCPFVCPEKYFHKHFADMTLPETSSSGIHRHHQRLRESSKITDLTETEIKRTRAAYYGLVEWFDQLLGTMLNSLRKNGLLDDTIIIYTSDHGEQLGDHGLWWKSTFYESSAGIPCIVSCPERFKGGRRITQNASLMDIGPTLIDFANAPELPNASGQSFRELLEGNSDSWPDRVFSEYFSPPQRMLKQGPWKLNVCMGYESELFNLNEDPNEQNNLINADECKDIVKSMTERIMLDWNFEYVKKNVELNMNEQRILAMWQNITKPEDPYLWPGPDTAVPQNFITPCPEAGQKGIK